MKTLPRIYYHENINLNTIINLDPQASKHLIAVLRLNIGDKVILFNGQGGQYTGLLLEINKNRGVYEVLIKIESYADINLESPLNIHLGQAISSSDKMDYVIQKSVELGVTDITPFIPERMSIKISPERLEAKILHWNKIIISACEQCGRNFIPNLQPILYFNDFVKEKNDSLKFLLVPKAEKKLADFKFQNKNIILSVGPEGGFSDQEIKMAGQHQFLPLSLGPRILRTETAALAMISALQTLWGDF